MKLLNIKYLALVIAVAALIVGGCGKDDGKDTCPIFTENAGTTAPGEYKPGSPVNINFKLAANPDGKKITSITLWQSIDGAAEVAIQGYQFTDLNDDSKTVEYAALLPTKTGKVEYFIRYAEKGGCTNFKPYTYTLKDSAVVDMTPYQADFVMTMTPDKQFMSTKRKAVYAAGEATGVASDIDLTWFYSDGTKTNNLVDPAYRGNDNVKPYNVSLPGASSTNFRSTSWTSTDFDGLKDHTKIQAVYDGGSDTKVDNNPDGRRASSASDYQAGKVIAFKNGAGKYGVILVKSLATSATTGSNIVVKMQPY